MRAKTRWTVAALLPLLAAAAGCGSNHEALGTGGDAAGGTSASGAGGTAGNGSGGIGAGGAAGSAGGQTGPAVLQLGPGGDAFANDVAIDPNDPNLVFITADNGGLFTSTDGGGTWVRKFGRDSITSQKDTAIEFDPKDSSILYVATAGGVFKSTDHGQSFFALRNGFPPYGIRVPSSRANSVSAIKVSPFDHNVIYAGMGRNAKWRTYDAFTTMGYKSVDAGQTWQALGVTGGPKLAAGYSTAAIAIASADGKTVYYAGMEGIFKSTDGGSSWSRITDSRLQQRIMDIDVVKDNPSIVYAAKGLNSTSTSDPDHYPTTSTFGLYKSIDAGATWVRLQPTGSPENDNVRVMVFHITDDAGQTIYAMFGGTIYKTSNGGKDWSCYSRPYNTGWATYFGTGAGLTFDVSRSDPSFLVAGTNVFIKTNGQPLSCDSAQTQQSWVPTYSTRGEVAGFYKNTGQIMTTGGWGIFVDPDDTQNVIVTNYDQGFSISKDGGKSWKNKLQYVRDNVTGLDNNDSFTAAKDGQGNYYVTFGGAKGSNPGAIGLLTSTDLESWKNLHTFRGSYAYVYAYESGSQHKLFVSVVGSDTTQRGLWVSADGGSSWNRLALGNGSPRNVAQDPSAPDTLYATFSGIPGGVWKSTDFGVKWNEVDNTPPGYSKPPMIDARVVAVNPKNGTEVAVGTRGHQGSGSVGGVWLSEDGGATWKKADVPLTNAKLVGDGSYDDPTTVAALDFTRDGKLVAGYRSESDEPSDVNVLAITDDHGATWAQLATGSMVTEFGHITADPVDPEVLWIATDGGGSYKYTMP